MAIRREVARRGLALLIVVGVLGLLAVLAAAFVTMAQLERRASMQRLYATKALLLARSGLEDALARLSAGQPSDYGGEDWDGNGVLTPGPEEELSEVYGPGKLDTDACPVRHAVRPSYPRSVGVNPRTVLVDGRHRGYSGRLQGDLASEGNLFALKVLPQAGIHVNGGGPQPASAGYNAVLRRILGTLAEALDREDGSDDGRPVDQADGERLVDLRPSGGWRSLEEIRDTAFAADPAAVRQRKIDALGPYLSLHAWADRKVIRPNAAAAYQDRAYQSWCDLKQGRWYDHGSTTYGAATRQAPDFERLPVAAGPIVGRAPVDLAWARRHRPVLIALLAGLKGLWLNERTSRNRNFGEADVIGHLRAAELALDWTQTSDNCRRAADYILASTTEIRTWQGWDAFCDAVPLVGTADVARKITADLDRSAMRSLLKANFNPNSDLNKFNPGESLARLVDKSDLLAYSTEFSLGPSGGGVWRAWGASSAAPGSSWPSVGCRSRSPPGRRCA